MRSGVACVLLVAAQAAGAQVVQPPALAEISVPSHSFEEMCFELEAGTGVRYAFDADAALEFNVHWHRGNRILYPVKSAAVARRAGVFRSPDRQAYCLMWTNHGHAAIALRARIDRAD